MEIFSRFKVPFRRQFLTVGPTLAQQHFANEVNINQIIARYRTTGLLTDPLRPATRLAQFGDFSDVVDYQTAQNIIIAADAAFMSLPAVVRKRFDNDPAKYIAFMEDEKNYDEALKLGLVDPKVEAEPLAVRVVEKSEKASKQSEHSTA